MKAEIRFGIVDSVDGGRARVRFDADELVSALLPVAQVSTRSDKWLQMPSVGDQVACLMDCNLEDGVIVGAIYSERDQPEGTLQGVQYSTGAALTFNPQTGRWSIASNTESMASVIGDLIDQIALLTVGTALGPSTPPINVAAVQAIKARLLTLLE